MITKRKVLFGVCCIAYVVLIVWAVSVAVHYALNWFAKANGSQAMQGSEITYDAPLDDGTGYVSSKKLVVPTDEDKEYHPNKPTVKLKSDHFEIEFPGEPWFTSGQIIEGERGDVDLVEGLPGVIGDPENPIDDTIQVGPPRPPKHDLDGEFRHGAGDPRRGECGPEPAPSPVPEPASILLVGTGLIVLTKFRKRT